MLLQVVIKCLWEPSVLDNRMSLNDLADDILIYIADCVTPNDIEAFAGVSRRIRSVSSARLARHRELLQSNWNTLVLDKFTDDEDAVDHPVRVLYEIWKDPHVKYYIKYIAYALDDSPNAISYGHINYRLNDTIWTMIDEIHSDDSLYQATPYFPHSEHKHDMVKCREGIQAGKEPAAFTLILASLPNIKRLRFSYGHVLDTEMLASMIAFSALDPQSRVLSMLSTVENYHWDTEGEESIEGVAIFCLLPSVRTIKGAHVGGGDKILKISGWENAVSCVENIEISRGTIDSRCLRSLLLPMRNLREFRYSHTTYGDPWEMHEWVNTLAEILGDGLEVLSLTSMDDTWDNGEGETVTTVKSFKSFKRLRELEVQVEAFIGDANDNMRLVQEVPRLIDTLPSSMETVTLMIKDHRDETELLFRDIETEKGSRLPRLSRVVHTGPLKDAIKYRLSSISVEVIRRERTVHYVHRDGTRRCEYADHVHFWLEDMPEGIRF